MNHELNLSFFIKKCFFEIENTDELTPDGKKILDLEIKPNGPSFEEYKQLLKENLSVFYLPGNIYELEDIFVDPDEELEIENYDIETQCHSVFENIRFILEDAGSSWDNIVDVQVFLTNMKDDFKTYNKIYAEYFKENQPCRTTIEIKSLPTPIAIELKVIATI
jgi:reactive intermediate/imine deaminase